MSDVTSTSAAAFSALLVAVGVVAAVLPVEAQTPPAAPIAREATGSTAAHSDLAPDFTRTDVEGRPVRLSRYRGKVVLLNFWATWCPPCRRELPSMEKLYLDLKDKPFQVLACDQQEDGDTVFTFTGQLDPAPTFPVLLDSKSVVSKAYGVPGLPTTFLIDKSGQIAHRAVGGREFGHPAIRALIEELMAA